MTRKERVSINSSSVQIGKRFKFQGLCGSEFELESNL